MLEKIIAHSGYTVEIMSGNFIHHD